MSFLSFKWRGLTSDSSTQLSFYNSFQIIINSILRETSPTSPSSTWVRPSNLHQILSSLGQLSTNAWLTWPICTNEMAHLQDFHHLYSIVSEKDLPDREWRALFGLSVHQTEIVNLRHFDL